MTKRLLFAIQSVATVGTRPVWAQEPGTTTGSPAWVADTLAGIQIRSVAAETRAGILIWDASVADSSLAYWTPSTNRERNISKNMFLNKEIH